jgi:serine/threonine-protein kinase
MAPEQATSAADVDARADVWSMGVMWFEALSGALPYTAETPMQMIGLLLSQDPAPLSAVATDVPLQLARAVERALRRDRAERWNSIGEFADALRACFPDGAFGPSPDNTGQLRALTRSETIISPSPPTPNTDERAMMVTVDASAPDDPASARDQQTLPARPSSQQSPADSAPSASPSAPRAHETLAGIEHPKPHPRPRWVVGASAMALAGVVAVVALGASRRATNEVQPASRRESTARSTSAIVDASSSPTQPDPVVATRQTQVTPSLSTDAGVSANVRSTAVNTGPTRTRTTSATTRTSAARTTTATTTATTAVGSTSSANAQGTRVRVMGW